MEGCHLADQGFLTAVFENYASQGRLRQLPQFVLLYVRLKRKQVIVVVFYCQLPARYEVCRYTSRNKYDYPLLALFSLLRLYLCLAVAPFLSDFS